MTTDDALYRFRLRALALAAELGNARAMACRAMGIHPCTFYRWRTQVLRLARRSCGQESGAGRGWPARPLRSSRSGWVAFALGQPGFGPARISAELRSPPLPVSLDTR